MILYTEKGKQKSKAKAARNNSRIESRVTQSENCNGLIAASLSWRLGKETSEHTPYHAWGVRLLVRPPFARCS
jgi:hypothetical protein